MQNLADVYTLEVPMKPGILKFKLPDSPSIWVSKTNNLSNRLAKIQAAIKNQRLPRDYLPAGIRERYWDVGALVAFQVVEPTEDIDDVLTNIQHELSIQGLLGHRKKLARQGKKLFYEVKHPKCPNVIYFGSYSESIGLVRAANVFRQRACDLSYRGYLVSECPLGRFLKGKDAAFCAGFSITPIPELSVVTERQVTLTLRSLKRGYEARGWRVLNS